jgi:hypothetical protein
MAGDDFEQMLRERLGALGGGAGPGSAQEAYQLVLELLDREDELESWLANPIDAFEDASGERLSNLDRLDVMKLVWGRPVDDASPNVERFRGFVDESDPELLRSLFALGDSLRERDQEMRGFRLS